MKNFKRALLKYIRENLGIYTIVTAFFMAGIIAGSVLLRLMDENELAEMYTAVSYYIDVLKNDSFEVLKPLQLLRVSYQKNIFFLMIIWLLGLLWIGSPFILVVLLLKGFALGFTVGFLVNNFALKGLFFCFAAVLPHNILLIPAYIVAAVTAASFSILKFKDRIAKKHADRNHFFQQYSLMMFLIFLLILAGGLVEAYITPVFMRLMISIL
ncbi:MAG: stage II sporulation protein M [Bacillota bacterium]|nr:stage II sporulation protein M [Bacillota bacterium]